MIDTIVLRIHNLKQRYGATALALYTKTKGAKAKVFRKSSNSEKSDDLGTTEMAYFDSGNFIKLCYHNSMRLGSYHYDLAYQVNDERDYLEFNFSIPKYLYGTNLAQFINYYDPFNSKDLYDKIFSFIREFIRQPFFVNTVMEEDVEINRIDLCYNQIFPTKDDALNYFRAQAIKIKKFSFSHKERVQMYGEETLMISTKRYLWKIYHKGAEFTKHDAKKIVKNKNNKLDVNFLQGVADRTLRYEITFHNSYMNYAFRQMYYEKTSNAKKSVYRYLFSTLKLDQDGSTKMRMKKFCLISSYDFWEKFKEIEPERWPLRYKGENFVTFNFSIFDYMYKFFWKYVNKFQVDGTTSAEQLAKKFALLNDDITTRNMVRRDKSHLRNINLLKSYAIASQEMPLSEMYRTGRISRRTYFNRLKDFKRVGLSDYNPAIAIIKPTLDYQEYKYLFGSYH